MALERYAQIQIDRGNIQASADARALVAKHGDISIDELTGRETSSQLWIGTGALGLYTTLDRRDNSPVKLRDYIASHNPEFRVSLGVREPLHPARLKAAGELRDADIRRLALANILPSDEPLVTQHFGTVTASELAAHIQSGDEVGERLLDNTRYALSLYEQSATSDSLVGVKETPPVDFIGLLDIDLSKAAQMGVHPAIEDEPYLTLDERLVENSPVIELLPEAFEAGTSYSDQHRRVIPLREYIGAKLPELGEKLGFVAEVPTSEIKDIDTLTIDDLKEIGVHLLAHNPNASDIDIDGKTYDVATQIAEIRNETEVGQILMTGFLDNIRYQVALAKAGKLAIRDKSEGKPPEPVKEEIQPASLTGQARDTLQEIGVDPTQVVPHLFKFESELEKIDGIQRVGLVYRDAGHARPYLSVLLQIRGAFDTKDSQQMDMLIKAGEAHGQFARGINDPFERPSGFDSLMDFIDGPAAKTANRWMQILEEKATELTDDGYKPKVGVVVGEVGFLSSKTYEEVMDVKKAHSESLRKLPGIETVGVGINQTNQGSEFYIQATVAQGTDVNSLPTEVDGVKIVYQPKKSISTARPAYPSQGE